MLKGNLLASEAAEGGVAANGTWLAVSGGTFWGDKIHHGPIDVAFRVEELGLVFVKVLAGICGFVFKLLDEDVESRCQEGAEERTYPVYLYLMSDDGFGESPRIIYPMIILESVVDHIWSEGSGRIQRSAGVIDTWYG